VVSFFSTDFGMCVAKLVDGMLVIEKGKSAEIVGVGGE
jgi:hypothetical protein